MLETYLSSPITRRRLRAGAAAGHIDAFADWLYLHGYKATSIANRLKSLAAWTDWMLAGGFTAQNLLTGSKRASWQSEKSSVLVTAADPIANRWQPPRYS